MLVARLRTRHGGGRHRRRRVRRRVRCGVRGRDDRRRDLRDRRRQARPLALEVAAVAALVAAAEEVEDLAHVRRHLAVERLQLLHRHRQRPLAAEQPAVRRVQRPDLLGRRPGPRQPHLVPIQLLQRRA